MKKYCPAIPVPRAESGPRDPGHRWRREMDMSRRNKTRFAPGNGNARDEELERVKKENQQLRMERDTLRVKKAMAFFVPRP